MKHSFDRLDTYIDHIIAIPGQKVLLFLGQLLGSLLIVLLTAVCAAHFVMYTPLWHTRLIQADLNGIAQAMQAVDRDCGIKYLRIGRHPIALLTKKSAPEQGVALAHPERWQGPYLHKILTVQTKPYELLQTKKGLYVVPGNGVQLPSGAIIGDTFSWCAHTDVNALSQTGGILFYQSAPLVREVVYGQSAEPEETLWSASTTLNDELKEFSSALTFAHNHQLESIMLA